MATHNQRVFKFDLRAKKITEVGKGAVGVIILTSKPYAVEDEEQAQATPAEFVQATYRTILHRFSQDENAVSSVTLANMALKQVGGDYRNWPQEAAGSSVQFYAVRLVSTLRSYTNWPVEKAAAQGATLATVTLKRVIITYPHWPTESASATAMTLAAVRLTPSP